MKQEKLGISRRRDNEYDLNLYTW